jgi:hypothetical protein
MQPTLKSLKNYAEFLTEAEKLNIPNLVFHSLPLKSVSDYADSERVPPNFPRPEDHFVIADYLIDLPVVALDVSTKSESYGQILAYTYGDYWLVADSLTDFLDKLKAQQETALFGSKHVV